MTLLIIILLLLILSIFMVDFIPVFYTWQSRIKIGKFQHDILWKKAVLKKSLHWLNHLPSTKIKDNNHLIIIDILKKQYTNHTVQAWQEASLLSGIYSVYKKNPSEEMKKEILKFTNKKIDENGYWKNKPTEVDACCLGYELMNIDFLDQEKIKPALDHLYQLILERIGEDGTVMYRKHTSNYRYVDTIGFICPFLVKYGLAFNNEEAVNLGFTQIKEYEKYGLLPSKIPSHAYEIYAHNPVGIYGWGRGAAWFILGVLETYNVLPEEHLQKQELKKLLEGLADTLQRYQQINGGFSWSLFINDRIDSSATAVFAWFFKEMGRQREAYLALEYLKSVTRRDGAVDFSQGDTKAIGVYSQEFTVLPFTQGFVLKAMNE